MVDSDMEWLTDLSFVGPLIRCRLRISISYLSLVRQSKPDPLTGQPQQTKNKKIFQI